MDVYLKIKIKNRSESEQKFIFKPKLFACNIKDKK
jgi:hypothetical protein